MQKCLPLLFVLSICNACNKSETKPADPPPTATPDSAASANKPTPAPASGEFKVAGASDLVFAMEELSKEFTKQTNIPVTFIPGSSGKLAAQIKEGAPFDVFLSANIAFTDDVVTSGACLADTKTPYARGRIVLWTPSSAAPPPEGFDKLVDAKYKHIAIAQPDHAPYGAAAKQALEKAGIWSKIENKMLYGTNVKDTMQFAETGSAEIAIIALALAKGSQGNSWEVPAEMHDPLVQGLVACKHGHEEQARRFVAFMISPTAQEILGRFGFEKP